VTSLVWTSGNLAGTTDFEFPMGGKWVEFPKEMAPTSRMSRLFSIRIHLLTLGISCNRLRLVQKTLVPVRNNSEKERGFETVTGQSNSGPIIA
jgi:hypothetical protein